MNLLHLETRKLSVSAGGRPVLREVDLLIPRGEVHVLFGPNGSGKTTLLAAIMGLPGYAITGGEILFNGERIDGLAADVIARKGIGLAFQRPPSIRGVTLRGFVDAVNRGRSPDDIAAESAALNVEGLEQRDLNLGFSGGELKRTELLKLYAQRPELVLLDEPESGVDLENIVLIARAIRRILSDSGAVSGLIITHTGYILDYIDADCGHVMVDGRIIATGRPRPIFHRIRAEGYAAAAQVREGKSAS